MVVPARSGLARSGDFRSAFSSSITPSATTLGELVRIARDRILETLALIRPGAPLVAPQGTPGTTAYTYVIVATNTRGHSPASLPTSITAGPDALSGGAFTQIAWTPVQRATGYQVYRVAGGVTQGRIATLGDVSVYNDVGAAGDGTTAPATNTSGTLGIFWSDDELLAIAVLGCKDLWRAFIDLHQEHFFTVNVLDVGLLALGDRLSGVPPNVHRILTIEARDACGVQFTPGKYNSVAFKAARQQAAVDSSSGATILYAVTGAGAPTGAPTIYTAPPVAQDVPIRLVYIPTLGSGFTLLDANPVPGEADAAVVAYIVAFALAKDREDRSPDPNWLAVYATEKESCLVASAPRQEQVPPVVTGILDDITGPGLAGWDED